MIFSRGGGSGGRHAAEEPRSSGRHAVDRDEASTNPGRDAARAGGAGRRRPVDDERAPAGGAAGRPGAGAGRSGPYDIADAPEDQPRVDLGSLQIPSIDGVEVRVQANADGIIQQVVLAYTDSALQLGVFAAPRSEGIWDEVRAEIRKSLFDDGVAVEEALGEYGTELRARVRTAEGLMDIRFIGIDGPRWMLRAVFQGRAAVDPEAAGPLTECLRGLVVDRGREAMPVREALPLRLPREIAEQAKARAAAGPEAPAAQAPGGAVNGAGSNGAGANVAASNGAGQAGGGTNGANFHGGGVYGAAPGGAGTYGAGENNAGENSAGEQGAGQSGAGANGAGQNSAGQNSAGQNSAGQNSAGTSGAGTGGSGPETAGPGGDAPRRRPSPRPRRAQ